MKLFSLVCVGAYCLVALVVGLRLLRLAARTGEAPELFIGSALFLGGAIGYPASVAAGLVVESSPYTGIRLAMGSMLGLFLGAWGMLLAWYTIYHRGETWARAVAVGVTVLLFLFLVDRLAVIGTAGAMPEPAPATPEWTNLLALASQGLVFLLTGISGFRYLGLMKKRLRLGLADPVVADRIRLWTWTASAAVCQYAYSIVSPFLDGWFDAAAVSGLVLGGLGLVIATMLTLAFFPPQSYLARLTARTGQEA